MGIVAAGKTFADVRQSLRTLGLDEAELAARGIRLLKLGMIHPLEPGIVTRFADGLAEIVVVEEKRPFIEAAVKDLLYGRPDAPVVTGKRTPDGGELLAAQGELGPDAIATALAARILATVDAPTVTAWRENRRPLTPRFPLPLAVRTPYFCSGCPHNSSTKTPAGSMVGAGIGCHALTLVMSPDLVGDVTGLTQMGGEGAQWLGMAPFLSRDHLLQNLGDGTFHHSGSLAVRAAVAGGANITYKLLYNSAVAMTGGQRAEGQMTVAEITRAMTAEGVRRIIVTTEDTRAYRRQRLARGVEVWHRDRLVEAQEALAAVEGVTMLIHDQECATELRRKRKRGLAPDPAERVVVNERVCEGCGDCGVQSNCLSVQPVDTEFGRKTRIDQSSCNKDYSCLKGDCPSFLTVTPAKNGSARPAASTVDSSSLPQPPTTLPRTGHHTTRVLGIGGTGVVTVAQILGTAATHAGLHVQALDQTGLAQKGGAVVSDVKIGRSAPDGANKAAAREVDLYLGADLLVAADPAHLGAADPGRTAAVVSTGKVATGGMVSDPSRTFPDVAALVDRVRESTDGERGVFLDARAVSSALFGHDQYATLLLVGAAHQSGALPIPAESIEHAIGLNGVQVATNVQAFRRGRQLVSDPAAFHAAVGPLPGGALPAPAVPPEVRRVVDLVAAPPDSELARLVAIRVPDLVGYQDARYAEEYARLVERVRGVEAQRVPGSTAFTEAVAHHLHRLMAYKDEYEVARLSLLPDVLDSVRAQFGPDARISYRLHPPVLRAMGLRGKITLGPWFRPVFRLLAAMRRVRGTRFDLFGYAGVRKVERALVTEYREVVEALSATLSPENVDRVVRIANLPDGVRGYEGIKLANVETYRRELAAARHELDAVLH